MNYLIRTAIYCACVLFAINILFVAWLMVVAYFRARAARRRQRMIVSMAYYCAKSEIPPGTYHAILEKLNRRR